MEEFEAGDVIKIVKSTKNNWYIKGETYTIHHTSIRKNKLKLHKDRIDSYWIDSEDCILISKKEILKNIQIW